MDLVTGFPSGLWITCSRRWLHASQLHLTVVVTMITFVIMTDCLSTNSLDAQKKTMIRRYPGNGMWQAKESNTIELGKRRLHLSEQSEIVSGNNIRHPNKRLGSGTQTSALHKLGIKEIGIGRSTDMRSSSQLIETRDGPPKEINEVRKKRAFDIIRAERTCTTVAEWIRPNIAKDINGTWVQVVQDADTVQYFYKVSCTERPNPDPATASTCPDCCLGIKSGYSSKCTTEKTFFMAKIRQRLNPSSDWQPRIFNDWITMDSGCVCLLSQNNS